MKLVVTFFKDFVSPSKLRCFKEHKHSSKPNSAQKQLINFFKKRRARKLMVFGLGPMGCIPLQRVLSTSGQCQEKTNKLALRFNQATSKLVNQLSSELPFASFEFGDAYDVVNDVITNPSKYGFDNAESPCCSFGRIRPALTCVPASTLCKDRTKYLFWDEYHPSDSANELIANELIKKLKFRPVNGADATSSAPAIAPFPEG
ncbi:hypothetical protein F0562_023424 [Nyssa sinensis]|uniref:GDSL esterase/lipase n=1 Tax=Nyssa sinensis TaxID=561372 RepID=A0A5J5BJK1_9ASTE|nr:hypothetical protein F0562_023424 [Nyssa sinensis]